ncbi:hypothetical protein F5146DRAFT_1042220 [Armillaria mellea]|nr:hypothetical protein F5146DRAFT_1042220 [Armillaria mellea]
MSWDSLHGAVSSGTLLATSWLNVLLYTAQVSLTSRWLRYWILASLVLDGACSVVVMASIYIYLVHGSQGPLQPTFTWTVPTIELLTYSSASIAQAFFCYRHWMIARNKWITGWIIILIIAYVMYDYALCSAICALTDLTIAFSLAWTCVPIETPYISTKNVLRRVIVQALTCGFTTAISTTLMTIFLFTVWNAYYSLFSVLGRIYSLTVLSTLVLLKVMHRSDPSTARMDGDGSTPGNPVALATIRFKHTSDTETTGGFTQMSSEASNHRPTLRNLAHDLEPFVHTV